MIGWLILKHGIGFTSLYMWKERSSPNKLRVLIADLENNP